MIKKSLAAALALTLFSAGPASASTTRLLSLGLDNWQLADDINFWNNPARLRSAPNEGVFEMGTQAAAGGNAAAGALTAGTQWGGFHKSFGSTVLAVYIRRPYGLNDFSAVAGPVATPFNGGNIKAAGVTGTVGLDAAGFGTGGNFVTAAAFVEDAGATAITGAPAPVQTLAVPQNYVDLLYAWPWGRMDWGLHFNFARNAPGEVGSQDYSNETTAAIPGSTKLRRLSQEFNLKTGWLWNGWERSWLQMAADFSVPDFSMEYDRERTSGLLNRSRISNDSDVNAGLMLQFSQKNQSEAAWAVTARMGQIDTSGKASRQADTVAGGGLEIDQNAHFTDNRKYVMLDYTWTRPFSALNTLLAASVGFQRQYTKQTWTFHDIVTPTLNHQDRVSSDANLVPIRVAIETQPWNLLAIRAGIQKNVFSAVTTRTEDRDSTAPTVVRVTETETSLADPAGTANGVGLSFGVGIHLAEGLMWDNVVRQTLLFEGPNVVGGSAPGMFAQSTLVYRWGGGEERYTKLKPLIPLKKLLSRLSKDDETPSPVAAPEPASAPTERYREEVPPPTPWGRPAAPQAVEEPVLP